MSLGLTTLAFFVKILQSWMLAEKVVKGENLHLWHYPSPFSETPGMSKSWKDGCSLLPPILEINMKLMLFPVQSDPTHSNVGRK